jgi:hypothetical protein
MKRFQVAVFGKQGCDKCDLLKKRLGKLLEEAHYSDFEMEYFDLGTIEGLVRFSQSEVLNPQRIPSLMVFLRDPDDASGRPQPLHNLKKIGLTGDQKDEILTFLTLETDYKDSGVLAPKAIREILDLALQKGRVGV